MYMAVYTMTPTTFLADEVDDAVTVTTTDLCRTRERCIREMWNGCVRKGFVARSIREFVDQLDDRSRFDLQWLLDPQNEEEVALVCRRLIPAAHHANPEEMPPHEWMRHLYSLRLSLSEFEIVMQNLSTSAASHGMVAFTYQIVEIEIPPTMNELLVSAEVVEQQDTIRQQAERIAQLRVSHARSRLQTEVLRQQLESLHRELDHYRSRKEREQDAHPASRRRLNFDNL